MLPLAKDTTYTRTFDLVNMEVLVVDDDSSIRLIIAMMIRSFGCNVQVASNGYEALKILQKTNIQIVISDWNMPDLDGVELCRSIRSTSHGRYIYTTLLTSRNERADYLKGMTAGADDFAVKPADRETMLVRLVAAKRVIDLEQKLRSKNMHITHLYEQISEDLDAAVALQRELLPDDREDDLFRIVSTNVPAARISGDCQNHFDLPDGRVIFYQADIAGHGIRAALLALSVQRILNAGFCQTYDLILEPDAIISRLNNRLQSSSEVPEYFTIFLGILDKGSGHIDYCQAGHPRPAIIRTDGSIEWVGEGGFPVGMIPDAEYESGRLFLKPGDWLTITTDGVLECPNQSGEQLGEARLENMLRNLGPSENVQNPGWELIKMLKSTWSQTEEFEDDVSILAINMK